MTGQERVEHLLTRIIVPLKRWAQSDAPKVRRVEVLELVRLAEEARQEAVALRGAPERVAIPARLRRLVLARAKYRCQLCNASLGEDGAFAHIDHVIPVARFGVTELDNLQALCADCNLRKSARRAG